MIRLGNQEIAHMLRYRQEKTDEILSSVDASYKKTGGFIAKDFDDIRMLACVLWDLASVIEAQVRLGSPVARHFTISPDMKKFLQEAYAAGDLEK